MSSAFIFPGQGSQKVGMGKDIYNSFSSAKEVFDEVDDSLSENLSKIIFDGPQEKLNLTEFAQPALMAVSIALVRVLETEMKFNLSKQVSMLAGHSLGEYSALASAKTFSLTDVSKLLKLRGKSMQEATPLGTGAMAAIIGSDLLKVKELLSILPKDEVCEVANNNSPGQIVISGHKTAIEKILKIAPDFNISKIIKLPVSAPFHCSLMAPAAAIIKDYMGNLNMHQPSVNLVSNITAKEESDPDIIKDLLIKQVTGTVKWYESINYMIERGVTRFVEVGEGKVLSGLVKRINSNVKTITINNSSQIEEFNKIL